MDSAANPPFGTDTIATHAGRRPSGHSGTVNPPVYHASTIVFERVADYESRQELFYDGVGYGLYNTPTTLALAEAVAALEGATHCVLVPSGTAAIATTLTTFAAPGGRILIPDSAYRTTCSFCEEILRPLGVEIVYYDAMIGAGIADLITPATSLVYLESPGSYTFEVQDLPAIAAVARRSGVPTAIDATWASPFFMRALDLGVDIAIQAGTKYLSGHSDITLGTMSVRDETLFRRLKHTANRFGHRVAGDECYMALRGVRTLGVRMRQHHATGLRLAEWLARRPEVRHVLHPAIPDHPGHACWMRDFSGASGLFGVLLRRYPTNAVAAMLEGMRLFGLGSSWGGYESLIVPAHPAPGPSARQEIGAGVLLRIHAGLENVEDLLADLAQGLERLGPAD